MQNTRFKFLCFADLIRLLITVEGEIYENAVLGNYGVAFGGMWMRW
jgi:hypothetical protein